MNLLAISKTSALSVSEGLLYALVAIAIVFIVLLLIIGVTSLIFKLTTLFKRGATPMESVGIVDDDMMAAVLTATIDYRNETKKDVRVISVKEIK